MKRIFLYGVLPLLLGLFAAWLRANELIYVINPITGLPENTMWVSGALKLLCPAVCAAYAVLALLRPKCVPSDAKSPALPVAACVSFCVLFGFAGYELYNYTFTRAVTGLIFGVLTLLCALALFFLGLKGLELRESSVYNALAAIPAFWACYALILIFRQRISDPIISDYIYLLMAFICILLFVYSMCGYVFGKNRMRLAAFCAPAGVFFCVTELFAPLFAALISPGAEFIQVSVNEAAPLAAFAVYMPFALDCILKNRNRIEM